MQLKLVTANDVYVIMVALAVIENFNRWVKPWKQKIFINSIYEPNFCQQVTFAYHFRINDFSRFSWLTFIGLRLHATKMSLRTQFGTVSKFARFRLTFTWHTRERTNTADCRPMRYLCCRPIWRACYSNVFFAAWAQGSMLRLLCLLQIALHYLVLNVFVFLT